MDAAGNLYIADYLNRVVEKVTPSGRLSVVAGTVNHLPLSPGPATNTFVQCAPSERVSTPGPATTSESLRPAAGWRWAAAATSTSPIRATRRWRWSPWR